MTKSDRTRSHSNLDVVQVLRAVAAISVTVMHFGQLHIMLIGAWPPKSEPLYSAAAGVDLFFVISGFIMVYSSERLFQQKHAPRTFLARRIARIVPLYWLTTVIAIKVEQTPFDMPQLMKSLSFIPFRQVNGIAPLYGVGWTLNYEMFFYTLFASVIIFRRERAVVLLGAVLAFFVWLGAQFASLPIPLRFWSDPIVLEFVLGMTIAMGYRWGFRLPGWISIILCTAGVLMIAHFSPHPPPSDYRILEWGAPAAMIMAGAVLWRGSAAQLPSMVTVFGDASYSIYLTHSIVAAAILSLWNRGLNTYPMAAVLIGAEVVTLALSITAYLYFERPVTRLVRTILEAKKANIGLPQVLASPDT